MEKFKIGDIVRFKNLSLGDYVKDYVYEPTVDKMYIVHGVTTPNEECHKFGAQVIKYDNGYVIVRFSTGLGKASFTQLGFRECNLELIKSNKTTMSIKEKFALAFTSEPQKTFRKLEITNGDNVLTDEGQKVFLTWLLSKNQDAFKIEVCDPIMQNEKEAA